MAEERSELRWWSDAERDPVHEAAARWFVLLQDPELPLEDALAWQRWIGADARHAEAFARIEKTYLDMGEMRRPALASALAGAGYEHVPAAHDYDGSVAVGAWIEKRQERNSRQPMFRGRFATFAAMAAAIIAALTWAISGGLLGGAEVLRTAIGENRTASLPDGSKVILGGDTELEFAYGAEWRRVELSRGEAFFVVAKDASRPFTVRAGNASVTAVGTQFNVRRRNERVMVAVVEGRVRVEPTPSLLTLGWPRHSGSPPAPVQVDAGERTIVAQASVAVATPLRNTSAVTSWQRGRLHFDRESLNDVLLDVNRYSAKPIVVADESVGALRITGTVLGDDVAGWVQSLERAFPIEAIEETDRIVVRRKRGID